MLFTLNSNEILSAPPCRRHCKYLGIPLDSEVDEIIGFYHSVTHPGINTTIYDIRNKYDWNGIYNNVGYFVSFSTYAYQHFIVLTMWIKPRHDCQTFSCSTTSATKGTSAYSTSWRIMVPLRNRPCIYMSRTVQGYLHSVILHSNVVYIDLYICHFSQWSLINLLLWCSNTIDENSVHTKNLSQIK